MFMSSAAENVSGSVVSLWRYPVKSMMGEPIEAAEVTQRGLWGDRTYALLDCGTGKVVSAKNPRKWPNLFRFRAVCTGDPLHAGTMPAVEVTLPDGRTLHSGQHDANQVLSAALGRAVTLESTAPPEPALEEYWPDIAELAQRDSVTDETMLAGTFFDAATVHLLTTATLKALGHSYPAGCFDACRFRPNIVVDAGPSQDGFVENAWVDHTVTIGDQVQLHIARPCPRCVMTTLPQGTLQQDTGILRTAVRQNQGHVGVYARVL
ncbi:MAG: sulfurase, partial [Planctomycetes bacterium RBG_16_64_10]